ncbi:LysR family transcriptional regulator [Enterococcus sp. LJL98]
MLDYRIQTFLSLTKTLSYTQTAKECNISQPAVTQQIQSLQNEWNIELVQYRKRKLSLTSAGSYLAKELEKLVPKVNEIYKNLQHMEETIHIGCGKTIGEFVLFREDFSLQKILSDDQVELSVDTTHYLLKNLENHKLDIAIVAGVFNHDDYFVTPYLKEKLVAICAPENGIAKKATSLVDLQNQHLFLREHGSGVYDIMMQKFNHANIPLSYFRNINEISNINVIKNLVADNRGISFLFETSIETELKSGLLCEIPLMETEAIYFYLVSRKEQQNDEKIKRILKKLLS